MMLDANVTAVIEVEVPLNATHTDIAAAIAVSCGPWVLLESVVCACLLIFELCAGAGL
jgi:hypothetical protein